MPLVYRIAKKRHPIYNATGAVLQGGRWSSPGIGVIYTAGSYALALLEQLVHAGRLQLPGTHHAMPIHVPDDLRVEQFDPAAHPGWNLDGSGVARNYGDVWFAAARTPVLRVPSVPGQPLEWNYVINPGHPEAARVTPLAAFDVVWNGWPFGPSTKLVPAAPP